jgi:acyl-CoA dehydrogenase
VHGAIGFTQEHKLHHLTRRLWSWRDEAGSEPVWARVLGAALLADGPDQLWPALTRVV